MIKLELSAENVQALIDVLGELPTKSNAWVLVAELQQALAEQAPSDLKDASVTD